MGGRHPAPREEIDMTHGPKAARSAPSPLRLALAALLVLAMANIAITPVVPVAQAAAPFITATKSATYPSHASGNAQPGDAITYTVNVGNTGGLDATGVTFGDDPDANTSFVPGSTTASSVAVSDTYPQTVIGNVSVNSALIPYSITANDFLGLNPT